MKDATKKIRLARAIQWMKAQEVSGMNKNEFCEATGLNRGTFFRYQKLVREQALDAMLTGQNETPEELPVPSFVELPLEVLRSAEPSLPASRLTSDPPVSSGRMISINGTSFSITVSEDISELALVHILRAVKQC